MGKKIAVFVVVLFLAVILLVRFAVRKVNQNLDQPEPSRPVVKEKVKREVTPEVRQKPLLVAKEKEEAVKRKPAPTVTVDERMQELAGLKALWNEYDEKYRATEDAMMHRQLEKVKREHPERYERMRERYELDRLRQEDPEAYREAMNAKRLEELERLKREQPEMYERRQEEYELDRLQQEDPEAYREAMNAKRLERLERLKREQPEMYEQTRERYELAQLRQEDPEAYREARNAKRLERLERLKREQPERREQLQERYELRRLREASGMYARMYLELAEELGVEVEDTLKNKMKQYEDEGFPSAMYP